MPKASSSKPARRPKLPASDPGSQPRTKRAAAAPAGAHEWVSFPGADEERTWLFDVTFLESPWMCIYGQGCPGVLTGPAPEREEGCCSYGAHFTDDADRARVESVAEGLTEDQWQFLSFGRRGHGKLNVVETTQQGDVTTRIHEDACIFLNRPGFPGGAGCALHRAALDSGSEPLSYKPDVCWQLPLRREDQLTDDGHVTSTIRQWDRRDWGQGGSEFHWWCTESSDAFRSSTPVHTQMRSELAAMVGKPVHKLLDKYLEARSAGLSDRDGQVSGKPADDRSSTTTLVEHPALRKRSK